ncbi:uncharacterized protein LOC135693500 isoform X1 [Rhopilema esculentum]|uniref:uncharacterized protein LOC135693500 isoform X1 n=1 Tax=Rhopilema esculentum TaxID=499914 RepID=UPI0031D67CF8
MEYPKGMIPVLATGIGDCLFNSVGKLLFGTEAVTPILRLLFITGAIGHVDHYIEEYRSRYNTKDCAYEMLYVMSTQEVFEKRPVMESTSVTDIIRFAVISEITELSKKDAYAGLLQVRYLVTALFRGINLYCNHPFYHVFMAPCLCACQDLLNPVNLMFMSTASSLFSNHHVLLIQKSGKD